MEAGCFFTLSPEGGTGATRKTAAVASQLSEVGGLGGLVGGTAGEREEKGATGRAANERVMRGLEEEREWLRLVKTGMSAWPVGTV